MIYEDVGIDGYQVQLTDGRTISLEEYMTNRDAVFAAARAEARLEGLLEGGLVEVTRNKLIMVAADVVDLVMEKNADYQNSWQKQGITGTLVRIADKLCRIETLADGRQALVAEEKLEQTLLDNIGYSFLALLWLKEKNAPS